MKDLFEGMFKPNSQGNTSAFGSAPDASSLASLLQLQGVNPRDAYVIAAQQSRDREQDALEKEKYEFQKNQALMKQEQMQQQQAAAQAQATQQQQREQQKMQM